MPCSAHTLRAAAVETTPHPQSWRCDSIWPPSGANDGDHNDPESSAHDIQSCTSSTPADPAAAETVFAQLAQRLGQHATRTLTSSRARVASDASAQPADRAQILPRAAR